MNDNFTDRLLDAGLREYSRVEAPDGFPRMARRKPAPAAFTRWWTIPALAACGLAAIVLAPAIPGQPEAPPAIGARITVPAVFNQPSPPPVAARRSSGAPEVYRSRFRVLTAVEIANLSAAPILLRHRGDQPLEELKIPELEIKPLVDPAEGTSSEGPFEKEKNQ